MICRKAQKRPRRAASVNPAGMGLISIKATVRTVWIGSGDHDVSGETVKGDSLLFRISLFWLVFLAAGGANVLIYTLLTS